MSNSSDVVRGAIVIDNFPEGCCYKSFEEFIKALPSWLAVQIPPNISNVTIGANQPSEAERGNLWVKVGSGSIFAGLYLFTGGSWTQIYPIPNQIFRVYGDSRTPPDGFSLADSFVTSAAATWMRSTWHVGGTISNPPVPAVDWYDVFDVVYTGY